MSAPTSTAASSSCTQPPDTDRDDTNQIDFESKCGRFGWETIDGTYIPYIFRSTDKYCAIRIADTKLLINYLNKMHLKLFNNVRIPAYQLTNGEITLLNEINAIHCDQQYGEPFTNVDYIVRIEDVKIFYEYLRICYYKLSTKSVDLRDRCGFMRINKQVIVAFVNKEDRIAIPVFYFENEQSFSFHTGVYASDWDVQYLRFCFAVQGIETFPNQATIEVITLDGVKSRFPPGTCFEPFWPESVNPKLLLINNLPPDDLHKMWTTQVNNIDNIVTMPNNVSYNNNNNNNKNLIEYGKPLLQIVGPQQIKYTCSPYHIAMLRVGHKFVPCINKNAYDANDYLITLPDLVHFFLNGVPLTKCKEYLDYLNVELYRGNLLQMQQLWNAKKCHTLNDYLPLMNLQDLRNNLSQLQLILMSE